MDRRTLPLRTLIVTLLLFPCTWALGQTSYTWNGGTSTDFATASNWTPSGVPGSSDDITIVSTSNDPVLDTDRTLDDVTLTSGTFNLGGHVLTVSTGSSLNGGTISNGELVMTTGSASISGVSVGCKLNLSCNIGSVGGSTFTDSVTIVHTYGSTASVNNNRFEDYVALKNDNGGALNIGAVADTFLAPVLIEAVGQGYITVAAGGAGNYFADDVTLTVNGGVSNQGITIGSNSSSGAHFAGDIYLNATTGSGYIDFNDGTNTHDGQLLIGAQGYHSGLLTLEAYGQTAAYDLDLSGLEDDATLQLGPGLTAEADVTAPDLSTTIGANCHFKGTLTAPKLIGWGSNGVYDGKVDVTMTQYNMSTGGNHFADTATIVAASAQGYSQYLGSATTDTFMAPVTITLTNQQNLYLGNGAGGMYCADDVTINNYGTTSSHIYIGGSSGTVNHFAGDITLNVDSTAGNVLFNQGTTTHDGSLLIGSYGYHSGTLTINAVYVQSAANAIDLSAMDNTSLLVLGTGLTLEGGLAGPGVRTTVNADCHFKGSVDLPNVSSWGTGGVYDGPARIEVPGASDLGTGGNMYSDSVHIIYSGSGKLYLGSSSLPDTVLGPYVLDVEGSHYVYMSNNSAGNYFADRVTINNHGTNSGRGIYIGNNAASTTYFADSLILNTDSTAGFINFYLGTATHAGRLLIGDEGYHSGVLTLQSYRQDTVLDMDLTLLDHNATLTLGSGLELEGDLTAPEDVYTTLASNCHFKGRVNIPKLYSWGTGGRFEGVTDLELHRNATYSTGGNYFIDSLTVTQWGSEQAAFGSGSTAADTVLGPMTINLEGSHYFYIGVSPGNYFADDVTLNHHGPLTSRGFYIGYYSTSGNHFGGDIILNTDSAAGFINFYNGTVTHEGLLRIGDEGYHSGVLTLDAYTQTGSGTIDLSGIDNTASITVQSNADITADLIYHNTSRSITLNGATFRGDVDIESPSLPVTYCDFHGTTSLEKTGGTNNLNKANVFHGEATIATSSNSNYQYWGYAEPDTFLSKLTLSNTSSQSLIMAYSSASVFEGDITFEGDTGKVIQMGGTTAGYKALLTGDAFQAIKRKNEIDDRIYRAEVNKSGGAVILEDTVEVYTELSLTDGVIKCVSDGELRLRDGITVVGGSDTSHVDGPVTKIGNDAFTFPLGDDGRYRPLAMTAPSSSTDEFTAEYRDRNSNGRHRHKYRESNISSIDEKGYWVFTREVGSSVPDVTLGWDSLTCGVSDTAGLVIVGWGSTDTAWVNLGGANLSGDTISGALTNAVTVVFGELALGSDTLNDLNCAYDPYEDCPLPVFSFTSGCVGDTVHFTDASTGDMTGAVYSWDFDDPLSSSDNFSSLTDPYHIFVSGGPFYVTLNIQGLNGCDLTYMDTVNMDRQLPDSSYFMSNLTTVEANNPVTFFYVGDGLSGQSFSWDMGDGTTYDSNDYALFDTISYSYDTAGVYYVKFYHWTDVNCKGVQTIAITVTMVPDECIIADFKASVSCMDDSTRFTDRSFGDVEDATYLWTYHSTYSGYENFSTEQNPQYKFGDEGPYEVTLTVTRDSLCWDRVTREIHFRNELQDTSELEFGANLVDINDNITFHLDGPISDAIYELDLGDGTVTASTDSFPLYDFVHDYNLADVYDVELTHGDSGCLSIRRFRIFVNDPNGSCPTVDAGPDTSLGFGASCYLGGSPTISGGTSPFSTEWIPASGLDDSSQVNPVVTPEFDQLYTVRVDDSNSCVNFDQVMVRVDSTLIVSTAGFDTVQNTVEPLMMSIRAPGFNETGRTGSESSYLIQLPSSGTSEVRLLFHRDPSEILAKVSFDVDNTGSVSNVALIQTDAYSKAETKTTLDGSYYSLSGGGITINTAFVKGYVDRLVGVFVPYWITCTGDDSRNNDQINLYGENGLPVYRAKGYFDQLGRTVQTQIRQYSSANTLAIQTVTDAFGREALKSLPAPIFNLSSCYEDGFMEAADGVPYSYAHFDLADYSEGTVIHGGEDDSPRGVYQGGMGSLGYYYSNSNTQEEFVPASKYPYSRVEYFDDPLNRVKRISIAGEHHRMGTDHENRIFHLGSGGEYRGHIGDQVTKKVTVDADGVEKITYTDRYGRVKATCFSGINSGCTHVVTKRIMYNGTRKSDIHVPIIHNEDVKLPLNSSRGVQANGNIIYHIKDMETGRELIEGEDWDLDEDIHSRAVSFYGQYAHKSLFLRIWYEYTEGYLNQYFEDYSDPTGRWIPDQSVQYRLDYGNWTLNEYYGVSDLLKSSIQPEAIDCQVISENTVESLEFGTETAEGVYPIYDENTDTYLDGSGNPAFSSEVEGFYTDVNGSGSDLYSTTTYQDHDVTLRLNVFGASIPPCDPLSLPDEVVWSRQRDNEGSQMLDRIFDPHYGSYGLDQNNRSWSPFDPVAGGLVYQLENQCVGHCINHVQDCGETGVDSGPSCGSEPGVSDPCAGIPETIMAEYRLEFEVMGKSGATYYHLNEDGIYQSGQTPTHYVYATLYRDCQCNRYFDFSSSLVDFGMTISDDELENYPDGIYVNLLDLWVRAPYETSWSNSETAPQFGNYQYMQYSVVADHHVVPSDIPPAISATNYRSVYEYNQLDQLISADDVDRGRVELLYNTAGQLRFYEDAFQRKPSERRYSYIDYDAAGRPIEIGEYDYKSDSLAGDGSGSNFGGFKFENDDWNWESLDFVASLDVSVKTILDEGSLDEAYRLSRRRIMYDIPDDNSSQYYPFPISGHEAQENLRGHVSKTWNDENVTWYSYLYDGKMDWTVQYNVDLDEYTIAEYVYTDYGNLETVTYKHGTSQSESFAHSLKYDHDQRLTEVRTSVDGGSSEVQATYEYYLHGPLKRQVKGQDLQGVDYVYTINGWLKSINSPNLGYSGTARFVDPGKDGIANGLSTDLFGMTLDYFSSDYRRRGTNINWGDASDMERHSGLIRSARWNTAYTGMDLTSSGKQNMYAYEYDWRRWLTSATFGDYEPTSDENGLAFTVASTIPGRVIYFDGISQSVGTPLQELPAPNFTSDANENYLVSNITYDKNGNLLTLDRNAYGSYLAMDRFEYNYTAGTNKLDHVDDSGTDFVDGGMQAIFQDIKSTQATGNYAYDAVGRLIGDADNSEKNFVEYDFTGKPTTVWWDASHTIHKASYLYDERGFRIKKTDYDNSGAWMTKTHYLRDAFGNLMETRTDESGGGAGPEEQDYSIVGLDKIGFYSRVDDEIRYQLTDHLGNVRVEYRSDANGAAELLSATDYYPFGMEMPGRGLLSSDGAASYGYQGEFAERDRNLKWVSFDLRTYDGRLGRFHNVDPMLQFHSPFLAMANNPLSNIDPTGGVTAGGGDGSCPCPATTMDPCPCMSGSGGAPPPSISSTPSNSSESGGGHATDSYFNWNYSSITPDMSQNIGADVLRPQVMDGDHVAIFPAYQDNTLLDLNIELLNQRRIINYRHGSMFVTEEPVPANDPEYSKEVKFDRITSIDELKAVLDMAYSAAKISGAVDEAFKWYKSGPHQRDPEWAIKVLKSFFEQANLSNEMLEKAIEVAPDFMEQILENVVEEQPEIERVIIIYSSKNGLVKHAMLVIDSETGEIGDTTIVTSGQLKDFRRKSLKGTIILEIDTLDEGFTIPAP
ncbi:MAG: hypothetical protein GC178_16630 [Flavobacteriales bacterium]|nr:hypothetical protein [Flavobacteriales bacterium]